MRSWEFDGKKGIVQSILGRTATIRTPRGGTFQCHNEGFHVGQVVYYLTDTLRLKVIAIRKEPFARQYDISDDFSYMEEDDYGELPIDGQSASWDFDFGRGENRNSIAEFQWPDESEHVCIPYGLED